MTAKTARTTARQRPKLRLLSLACQGLVSRRIGSGPEALAEVLVGGVAEDGNDHRVTSSGVLRLRRLRARRRPQRRRRRRSACPGCGRATWPWHRLARWPCQCCGRRGGGRRSGGTIAVAMCLRPSRPLKGESGCMEMQLDGGVVARAGGAWCP